MSEGWNLLAIGIGGALGALLRYGLVSIGLRVSEKTIPWGIVAANLIGCFLIGIFYSLDQKQLPLYAKLGITVGLIGALTTFSTLCLDFVVLYTRHPLLAASYLVMSLVGGVGLVIIGQYVARSYFV